MKNVSEWKFSAALANVDLARIVQEAGDSHGKEAFGVVRLRVDNGFIVLSVVENLRRAGFDGPRPEGYLTNHSRVVWASSFVPDGKVVVQDLESPYTLAPAGAVAVFVCDSQNEADELIGALVDRVVVQVEVF